MGEISSLEGKTVRLTEFRRGLAKFTQLAIIDEKTNKRDYPNTGDTFELDWQTYVDTDESSGFGTVRKVIEEQFSNIDPEELFDQISSEVRNVCDFADWSKIQAQIVSMKDNFDEKDIKVFMIAVWAQYFSKPFDVFWLAAMADHALMIKDNRYAHGYFVALIEQTRNNQAHFLRGEKNLKSASLGGLAKSAQTRLRTGSVISEISRLLKSGHSIFRAAELAYRNGLGTSAVANRKLWNRHLKK